MVKLTKHDLIFILKQIKIAEAHAAGGDLRTLVEEAAEAAGAAGTGAAQAHLLPYGLRTVDGSYNNLFDGRETWGSSGQPFKQLAPISWVTESDDSIVFGAGTPGQTTFTDGDYSQMGPGTGPGGLGGGTVVDADPRIISNLIVDQTSNNPAAIMVYEALLAEGRVATREQQVVGGVPQVHASDVIGPNGAILAVAGSPIYVYEFENFSPDIGDSAPYNSMFTLFGQFFDHGLDLVAKGGNGTVYIPLQPDDPLYVVGSNTNFMVMTRASLDADGNVAANVTTPWVDQNQTYTSHPSHQVFLREYELHDNAPVATGHLLDGVRGLATWADVKAQARDLLGIELTDLDVGMVPMLLTDPYGAFIRGPNGLPLILAGFKTDGTPIYIEGDLADPVNPSAIQLTAGLSYWDGVGNPAEAGSNMETLLATDVIQVGSTPTVLGGGAGLVLSAARAPNAFLDDIAHAAAPVAVGGVLQADTDSEVGYSGGFNTRGQQTQYDNELLDAHYITGDGRGNENVGLTAIHHVFHSEHNNTVEDMKKVVLESLDLAFINEWLDPEHQITSLTQIDTPAEINALVWDGERLFQAGRFTTEMQYQHLVFEEFARKMQPDIDAFLFEPSSDVDPVIFAEFAHAVYRFGHSMLNQDIDRLVDNGDGTFSFDNITLFEGFLNPLEFGAVDTNGNVLVDHDTAAGAIIRGMSRQSGNEIDEFVTDVLRNQLVGIPLDLAALNIARGRDVGLPTLNEARAQFYEMAGQDTQLKPYVSWADFGLNLQNPVSIVNFIAAYGRHDSIEAESTLDGKRAAAALLVLGGAGAPADRIDFLNSTGAWATQETGLNEVDLWIGGLAEKKMDFGGMLGSTFAFVFELQMENLQEADRFYYLSRVQGLNLLNELENNSLSKIILRNTDFGEESTALPGDIFSTPVFTLELDVNKQEDYTPVTTAELVAATAARDAAQDAYDAAALAAAEDDVADLQAALAAAVTDAESDAAGLLDILVEIATTEPVNTTALTIALAAYVQAVNADNALPAAQAALAAAVADDQAAAAALTALSDAQAALAALEVVNGRDPTHGDALLEALGPLVERRDTNNDGVTDYLKFNGGDHVVIGGTAGADTIIAGEGDDSIWGYGGNDNLEGGYGVDHIHGGEGDDIITNAGTDIGAMDFLHGEAGNDVIQGGSGLALIFGNEGNDFIIGGPDGKHLLGGLGTDFVLGGDGIDFVMGNEGDDWLEGGGRFDTLAGENSELFFNSSIIGHDVMLGGSNDTDYDAESGDDIMFQNEGIQRNNGMAGFDWVINKNDPNAGNIDLGIPIFATQEAFVLRDRMDLVEGASGWIYDDVIVGRAQVLGARAELDNTAAIPAADSQLDSFSNALLQKNVSLIDGLADLVAHRERVVARDANGVAYTYVDANGVVREEQIVVDSANASDILLGGGGNDLIQGLVGDDVIDGDKWLNVRIRLNDLNGNEIGTVESMTSQVFDLDGQLLFGGRTLDALMFDRTLNPSQLEIVREILDGDVDNSDIDTAAFIDVVENYTITANADGSITVDHTGFDRANFPDPGEGGRRAESDGVDRLFNIEMLRFSDGAGGFVDYTIAEVLPVPATGAAVISDLTPLEGQALMLDTSTIADINGVGTLQYQWQRSTNGTTWTDIGGANDSSYTPQDALLTFSGPDAGAQLRVVVSFVDGLGTFETIVSAATGPVGINWEALVGSTFNGLAGNDFAVGSNLPVLANDTLRGNAGDDSLWGRAGTDILVGGAGNDDLHGGAGTDRADYAGAITNFRFTSDGTTLTIIDTTGAEGTDTAENVENIRFNNINYRVVTGTAGHDTALNGVLGTNDSQLVIGRDGWDTMHGGDGSDILLGGDGSDNVMGGAGDDYIIQYAADVGFDRIDGGAGTNDTYVLHGTDAAETFRIYTRAEAEALGIAIVNASSTIIVTRNGTTTASKIAELRNIEEIVINTANTTVNDGNGVVNGGPAGGDTIEVIGNFVGSGLSYSTITIAGSSANDTVDITGLTSDHRIVFDSNGGTDTLVGAVRPQDVFNGDNLNDQRLTATTAAATDVTSAFGSVDGLNALMGAGARAQLRELGFFAPVTEGLGRGLSPLVERLSLDSDFELTQFVLQTNLDVFENPLAGGMDQMPLDLVELVRPGAGAPGMLSAFEPAHDDRRMLASNVDFFAY